MYTRNQGCWREPPHTERKTYGCQVKLSQFRCQNFFIQDHILYFKITHTSQKTMAEKGCIIHITLGGLSEAETWRPGHLLTQPVTIAENLGGQRLKTQVRSSIRIHP